MDRSCCEYILQYIRGVALFSCCMPSYLARGAHPKSPMSPQLLREPPPNWPPPPWTDALGPRYRLLFIPF